MHLTLFDVQAVVDERNRLIAEREREAILLGGVKLDRNRKRIWRLGWLTRREREGQHGLAPQATTA